MTGATSFKKSLSIISLSWFVFACGQGGVDSRTAQEVNRFPGFSEQIHGVHLRSAEATRDLEAWLETQALRSIHGLFLNISPPGAALGAVSASPSRQDPDYFFHWVRDSSIVMSEVIDLYARASNSKDRNFLFKVLDQFVEFSRANQMTPNLSGGEGEPKFNIDGSAFMGEWGRPQNDGPALRAITLTRLARLLLAEGGQEGYVRSRLYDGLIPGRSLIKTDLEFVSHHWQDSCFDLWEDTKGQHFYARMVQRRSLLDGAELADLLGDFKASVWYRSQAKALETEILKHWDASRGYWVETLNWSGGNSNKSSGLDVAIILGVLHGSIGDFFLSPGSDRVIATAEKLRETFKEQYLLNRNPVLGTAVGRYPEDSYDGLTVGDRPGNPWVLSTLAYAELNYRIAQEWGAQGRVELTALNLPYVRSVLGSAAAGHRWLKVGTRLERGSAEFDLLLDRIRENGDSFFARVKFHTPADGSLAEQFNRVSGYMQGARDLAWSYASFLTALAERNRLLRH